MLNVRLTCDGRDYAVLLPVSEKRLEKIEKTLPEDAEITDIFIISPDKKRLDVGDLSETNLLFLNNIAFLLMNYDSIDRKLIFSNMEAGASLEESIKQLKFS